MRRVVALVLGMVMVALPAAAAAQPAEPAGSVQPVRVEGLHRPAQVVRDTDGVPHLRAASEHDLWFLQGWVHAQDRLFQMDLSRRQPSGTLAELLGPDALPGDVELRTIGLRRAAERSLSALSPRAQALLDRYAQGINRWVAEHPLPEQYGALGITRFEPWTPLDSATIVKAAAFSLSFDLDIDQTTSLQAYQAAGAAQGFDGAALFFSDVFRVEPFGDATTVPDANRPAPAPEDANPAHPQAGSRAARGVVADAVAELGARYLERVRGLPLFDEVLSDVARHGSNEWAVSGARTTSGAPLLANDPHLSLSSPSTFYPQQLVGGGINVSGEGFPGVPILAQGQNRHIAWGSTTNPLDVTDTFAEQVVADPASPSGLSIVHQGAREPIEAVPETFRVNDPASPAPDDVTVVPPGEGVPEATLVVPRRNNGPIIALDTEAGTALSVQYTGFSGTRELDTFLGFATARNLEDFKEALTFFDVGSQNWAYTDRRGTIAYFTSAELPLREDLQAGTVKGLPPFFVRDGTGGNEWLPATTTYPGQAVPYEILPPEEMPQLVNPPAGYFVNANNDPAGTTLDNDPLNRDPPMRFGLVSFARW